MVFTILQEVRFQIILFLDIQMVERAHSMVFIVAQQLLLLLFLAIQLVISLTLVPEVFGALGWRVLGSHLLSTITPLLPFQGLERMSPAFTFRVILAQLTIVIKFLILVIPTLPVLPMELA